MNLVISKTASNNKDCDKHFELSCNIFYWLELIVERVHDSLYNNNKNKINIVHTGS